jgi:hypothetical protein
MASTSATYRYILTGLPPIDSGERVFISVDSSVSMKTESPRMYATRDKIFRN